MTVIVINIAKMETMVMLIKILCAVKLGGTFYPLLRPL